MLPGLLEDLLPNGGLRNALLNFCSGNELFGRQKEESYVVKQGWSTVEAGPVGGCCYLWLLPCCSSKGAPGSAVLLTASSVKAAACSVANHAEKMYSAARNDLQPCWKCYTAGVAGERVERWRRAVSLISQPQGHPFGGGSQTRLRKLVLELAIAFGVPKFH